jgi:hypothetical protein
VAGARNYQSESFGSIVKLKNTGAEACKICYRVRQRTYGDNTKDRVTVYEQN